MSQAESITLTDAGYMGLGLYIGHKSFARRGQFEDFKLDYDAVLAEFRQAGLMRGNKMDLELGREVFNARFPGALGSQTHMYAPDLCYKRWEGKVA